MRDYIFDIVYGTLEEKKHSDELFHEICRKETMHMARDRHFVQREALGTIERAIELDEYLGAVSHTPVAKMDLSSARFCGWELMSCFIWIRCRMPPPAMRWFY